MNIFLITFQAVAAMLGIGVLGFWIIGKKQLPANALGLLTSIAIDIAIPCVVLANILIQFAPGELPGWWQLPLWWIGYTVVALLLALLTSRMTRKAIRGEWITSLWYQNGIFFPLIIITGLFGDPAIYLVQLFLFIFLQPTVVFTTYPLFFPQKAQGQELNWRRVVNPVIVVTLAGLVIALTGISQYVPEFLVMILSLVGAMALPLFMLILGGNVYNDFKYNSKEERKIEWREVFKFVMVKNLLFPLAFLGLLIWLRPGYAVSLIILLQAAVPPITAIPIFAERCGGSRAIANQYIVASFVFSVISIPAMIFLFSIFFPFPG